MAYLKPDQTVFFAQGNITSIVEKVAFRKYLTKPRLDKKTGEYRRKWKSMPYAICKVLMSDDQLGPVGEQFLIAGYRLQKKYLQGKMVLVMGNEYVADYENEYGNRWVSNMIRQENENDKKRINPSPVCGLTKRFAPRKTQSCWPSKSLRAGVLVGSLARNPNRKTPTKKKTIV